MISFDFRLKRDLNIFKINIYNNLELWVLIHLTDNKSNLVTKKAKYIFLKKSKFN